MMCLYTRRIDIIPIIPRIVNNDEYFGLLNPCFQDESFFSRRGLNSMRDLCDRSIFNVEKYQETLVKSIELLRKAFLYEVANEVS